MLRHGALRKSCSNGSLHCGPSALRSGWRWVGSCRWVAWPRKAWPWR